ncbi:MAG: NusG domain II-containing protein [Syntrophomonas sp.]|nr:NusG domain II-containing protein [Syntrophomonas sp.]
MNTRIFKIGDKILIVSIAIIVVILMLLKTVEVNPDKQLTAVIKQNGNLIKQINLNDLKNPEYIHLNDGINQVILAEKGRIRFLESDCPNQTCVKTGWLTKSGDKAVCIPSKVVITIAGYNKQVDIFSY